MSAEDVSHPHNQQGTNLDRDIAIVGMACRVPGASNYERYWVAVSRGEDCITEIPLQRWDCNQHYSPERADSDRSISKWGGYLDDIGFDAGFFGISPREAADMDPQQQVLLEEVWRCIEDSGIDPEQLSRERTAVYVGAMAMDHYHELHQRATGRYSCSGAYACMLSNRVSHCLDLSGPSITLDTACSSSLVAVDLACKALQAGESDFAISAGVSLNLHPFKYIAFSQARMLSPSGRCRTFDANADGYVPGEGVTVLLLQPMSAAQAQRRHIYGVIKASAVNHVGRTRSLTTPSVVSQQRLLELAMRRSGIPASTISYMELHGTGTSLGDPIEIEALLRSFGHGAVSESGCAIGSVKANIGHLEAAAGIAGVIKVLMMMRHKCIPPQINVQHLNPLLALEGSRFFVPASAMPWKLTDGPRRAGVSSFGFGGVNAHLILEEAPRAQDGEFTTYMEGGYAVLAISAKSPHSLRRYIAQWCSFIEQLEPHESVKRLAARFTRQRPQFEHRYGIAFRDRDDLHRQLTAVSQTAGVIPNPSTETATLLLVLGALQEEEGVRLAMLLDCDRFRAHFERCERASTNAQSASRRELELRTATALREFVHAYSLANLLIELLPDAEIVLTGDGPGYLAALCVGGWMTPEVAAATLIEDQCAISLTSLGSRLVLDPSGNRVGSAVLTAVDVLQLFADFEPLTSQMRAVVLRGEQLQVHRPTYKKYIGEWRDGLDSRLDPASADLHRAVIDVFAHASCMSRLERTWDLSRSHRFGNARFSEVLELLARGLVKRMELPLLLAQSAEMGAEIAERLNARRDCLQLAVDLPILYGRVRAEFPQLAELRAHLAANQQSTVTAAAIVHFGHSSARQFVTTEDVIRWDHAAALEVALVKLWNRGFKVDWHQLLLVSPPGGSGLPGYPFERGDPPVTPRESTTPTQTRTTVPRIELADLDSTRDSRRPAQPIARVALAPMEQDVAPPIHRVPRAANIMPVVTMQLDGHIALLRIAEHATRNALTAQVTAELVEGLRVASDAMQVHAIVLHGLEDVFCSGATKEFLLQIAAGEVHFTELAPLYNGILDSKVPIIAAMTGHAYGGGFLLGLYCDFALFANESVYSANFMSLGFTPGMGATLMMAERLGASLANEMMYTGRTFTGAEMREYNPQLRVVNKTAVLDQAMRLARALSKVPRDALTRLRQTLVAPVHERLPGAIQRELQMHAQSFALPSTAARIVQAYGQHSEPQASAPVSKAPSTLRPSESEAPTTLIETIEQVLPPRGLDFHEGDAAICRFVASLLMLEIPVRFTDNLIGLGVDSVLAIEIVTHINAVTGATLSAADLYEQPTLGALVAAARRDAGTSAVDHLPPQSAAVPEPARNISEGEDHHESIPMQRLLNEAAVIEPLQTMPGIVGLEASQSTDIAIVGVACRFPQANNVAEFFANLCAGRDCITRVPDGRWEAEEFYDPRRGTPGKAVSNCGGFLDDIGGFDAEFFDISAREATYMDPQHRLFLQESWKAMEDAGYAHAPPGSIGVFVGIRPGEYLETLALNECHAHTLTGSDLAMVPARIAYHLNLQGPCLAVDTACSASLVAIHLARQSLLSGECEMALAGGVTILSSPRLLVETSNAGMLSASGRCATFDESADGFVPAEGVGVVLLRRLDAALAAGDKIYALIKATGTNQDGRTASITAPSAAAQSRLIADVIRRSGVSAQSIQYVEAHGTGTQLGDPIEVRGLTDAFSKFTREVGFCQIGSVKTNIGHTVCAAGVAGLLKVALMLRHATIVPSLHHHRDNAAIEFARTPFRVVDELQSWTSPASGEKRRAAVSSFGFSGINSHAVLEEAPQRARPTGAHQPGAVILTFSARSPQALQQRLQEMADFIGASSITPAGLADLAYTLSVKRPHFEYRWALVAASWEEACQQLSRARREGPERWQRANLGSQTPPRAAAAIRQFAELRDPLQYRELAQPVIDAYVQGSEIDWACCHPVGTRLQVDLPSYPFRETRYWLARPHPVVAGRSAEEQPVATGLEPKDPALEMYVPSWVEQISSGAPPRAGATLIIHAAPDRKLLSRFAAANPHSQVIDWTRGMHSQIAELCVGAAHVCFLCGGEDAVSETDTVTLDTVLERGVYALLEFINLAQPLAARAGEQLVVSIFLRGQLLVTREDRCLFPAHASIVGLVRVAAKECPNLQLRLIDTDEASIEQCLPQMLAAPMSTDANVAAYRQGRRYVPTLKIADSSPAQRAGLRRGGTYVIIGGAGGIGSSLCEFLAREFQANIVVAGRREAGPREAALMKSIMALGGRGHYLRCDVCERAQVSALLNFARHQFGQINGIIHSALVLHDRALARMSKVDFGAALDPKLKGAYVLAMESAGLPLDFLAFFSSIASFVGNPGQANYSAGCTFIDAFCGYLNLTGRRAISINWGLWGEVGIVSTPRHIALMRQRGIAPLGTSEALEAFRTALMSSHWQIAVARLGPAFFQYSRVPLAAERAPPRAQMLHERALALRAMASDDSFASLERLSRLWIKKAYERFEPQLQPTGGPRTAFLRSLGSYL